MMTEDALKLYKECSEFHLKLTKMAVELESKMVASGSVPDQVDAALVAREAAKAMEHCASQLRKLETLTTQVCCALWASTPASASRIKTEYCSAYPSVTYHPNVPSFTRSHDKYVAAMRALGVPDPTIETGCLSIHWKRLSEMVTSLMNQGLPLPEGIDVKDVAPKFTLNARSNGKLGCQKSSALSSEESAVEEVSDEYESDPF